MAATPDGASPPAPPPGKAAVRSAHLAGRRALAPGDLDAAARALADRVLALLDDLVGRDGLRLVAAYLDLPGEPPTGPLLDALLARGVAVVVPTLRADGDLDWAPLAPGGTTRAGLAGTRVPVAGTRPPEELGRVQTVLVPGVAGDRRGGRLGRGGGSYDRALPRAAPGTPVVLLLHDGEVVDAVPTEPHDRPVTHLVTPGATLTTAAWRPGPLAHDS